MSKARTDFALIEGNLQLVMSELSKLRARVYLCRMLLLATASIWALLAVVLLLR